jgi:small-conductance mechanosensitive channel
MDSKHGGQIKIKSITISAIIAFVVLLIIVAIWYLHDLEILRLPAIIMKITEKLLFVIVVILVASVVLRITIGRFYKIFDQPEERIFYSKLWNWTIYVISLFVILFYFGVSLGNITLFFGLMATGFAFAVRDIIISYFGWMVLLRKKPFRIGDYIRIGEEEGKVMHIGTFYVLLDKTHDLPEDYTRVPNRLFLEKSIYKLGTENFLEQLDFPITDVLSGNSTFLVEMEKEVSKILDNGQYISIYYNIKNDKLFLEVEYLVSFKNRRDIRSKIICKIFESLKGTVKFEA